MKGGKVRPKPTSLKGLARPLLEAFYDEQFAPRDERRVILAYPKADRPSQGEVLASEGEEAFPDALVLAAARNPNPTYAIAVFEAYVTTLNDQDDVPLVAGTLHDRHVIGDPTVRERAVVLLVDQDGAIDSQFYDPATRARLKHEAESMTAGTVVEALQALCSGEIRSRLDA